MQSEKVIVPWQFRPSSVEANQYALRRPQAGQKDSEFRMKRLNFRRIGCSLDSNNRIECWGWNIGEFQVGNAQIGNTQRGSLPCNGESCLLDVGFAGQV
jgi:hypothetical protein